MLVIRTEKEEERPSNHRRRRCTDLQQLTLRDNLATFGLRHPLQIQTGRDPVNKEGTMLRVSSLVGVAAALIATPLLGATAWAAACVSAPVAVYTAAGFSCFVDG